MATAKTPGEAVLTFESAASWGAWLAKHHASSGAVGVLIGKKTGKGPAITYREALDLALVWGWIDSQKRAHDEHAWTQRFGPRTAKSPWSKINRARAEVLIAEGRMRPPGLAEVDSARKDGRWASAYDSARTADVPEDLAAALARNRAARAFFDALDGANRYAILWRVQTAKKPETRAARIALFVTMCAEGRTLHPPRASRGKGAKAGR